MYSKEIREKIANFKKQYRSRCGSLVKWKNLKVKDFSLDEMLAFFIVESNGSIKKMLNMIDHLVEEIDVKGRSQIAHENQRSGIDLIRTPKGTLKLIGYNPDAELRRKGQHQGGNPRVTKDGQGNKTFQKTEERLYDLGKEVREMFPGKPVFFIENAMQAIRQHAALRKISIDKVVSSIKKGRYIIDTDYWRVIPNKKNESKERKVVVINESDLSNLTDFIEMTEQKFHSNLRKFISQLLEDPVNAQPSDLFKIYGYNRSNLLKCLLHGKDPILLRSEKISDKDENGEPKTATMIVKFKCPKKNFDRKLQKLFIKLFEKNVPIKENKYGDLNEDGGGATGCCGAIDGMGGEGARGGAFITSLNKGKKNDVIRRKMPTEIEETTATTNTGNYQYTVPFIGDKETLARKNGVGGSVSINKA